MTKDEMIEKIMSKSGITREQAEEALEKNNNDLLDAMIYVERTYMNAHKYDSSYNCNNAYNPGNDFTAPGFNQKSAHIDPEFKKTLDSLLKTVWKNHLAVTYKGEEVLSMPILIWIVLLIASTSLLALVMIISMFFDVRYYFKGVTVNTKKINGIMDCVYGFVNKIKTGLLS